MDLYGRRQEQAALDRILDTARQGDGAALMLWGEPGIGKTALLEHVAESAAADFTIMRCRGTRLESRLAFAALHELLWPVMERISTLPEPQAKALNGALGISSDVADRFLIGVAVLTLIRELTGERPVLLIADDAQWLDEPSAHLLVFVARRLRNEPVAMLFTGHDDPVEGAWEKLPAMEVRGLDDEDARLLARAVVPHADEAVIRRTVRAAAGNPLALQELPASVAAGDISALPLADERIAVGPRLRRAFATRIERLSAPARIALLLTAADDRSDRNTVYQAGDVLGLDTETWEEALHSGLLTMRSDGRICFRHPLMGAVVYEEAPPADRQAVHRALASVLTGENAGELRPWHLAAAIQAAGRTDEDVARLLEESAHRSWARGACATAGRALRRAATLSPAMEDAARRLAHGARAAWEAGQVDVARGMLDRAEEMSSEATAAGHSDGLRGLIEFAHGNLENASRHLTGDMERVADPEQASKLGNMAVRAAWATGHSGLQREALQRLERRTRQGGFPNAELLPLLRQWWTEDQGGDADDRDDREQVVVPGAEILTRLSGTSWLQMPPAVLGMVWGIEYVLREALQRETDRLRHTDQVTALAQALAQTAALDIVQGSWTLAKANALQGLEVAEEIGDDHLASQCRSSLGWLAAARGEEWTVADFAARTIEMSVPREVRVLSASAQWSLGLSALVAGRAEEALDRLVRLGEQGHHAAHPTIALLAAADTAEAALQAGQRATAEVQAQLLRRCAQRTGAAWAISATHLVHALLASGADAEKQFRLALDVPGARSRPFNHARTRLLYGEWLRRARRRTDARTQLAEAAETFRRLDAAPLLARTRAEQELTGQQPRRDSAPARDTTTILTPQELRVARLAAEGLTNREIGAQLLISPRTVGHHLANVFPKLGILSRADLARVDFEDGLRLMG